MPITTGFRRRGRQDMQCHASACALFCFIMCFASVQSFTATLEPSTQYGSLVHSHGYCSYRYQNHPSQLYSVTEESSSTGYTVKVSYEGTSCELNVQQGETILEALERNGVGDTLSLPSMPSDCRRGNCMTCTAVCSSPDTSSLVRGEDGLSEEVSSLIAKRGYVLTCSSYVQGAGLELELGENHEAWDLVYKTRFETEQAQLVARAAMAKLIRKTAERNVEEWAEETEEVLQRSGGEASTK